MTTDTEDLKEHIGWVDGLVSYVYKTWAPEQVIQDTAIQLLGRQMWHLSVEDFEAEIQRIQHRIFNEALLERCARRRKAQ